MTENHALGMTFKDGEAIIRQGDTGDCMYVIQEGRVEVVVMLNENETVLAVRKQGDFFGEMAIFNQEIRMATVRALGEVRVLSVDKRNLMRRIHEDPSLAYHIILALSQRIRELSDDVVRLDQKLLNLTGY
jgi:CRP-like cAMP-binding protein